MEIDKIKLEINSNSWKEKVVSVFESLDKNPNDWLQYFLLWLLYHDINTEDINNKEWMDNRTNVQKNRFKKERNLTCLYELGCIYASKGDWQQAGACFDEFTQKHPESFFSWYFLGYCFLMMDLDKEALGAFVNSLKYKENIFEHCSRYMIALCLFNLFGFREAISYLEKIPKKIPQILFQDLGIEIVVFQVPGFRFTADDINGLFLLCRALKNWQDNKLEAARRLLLEFTEKFKRKQVVTAKFSLRLSDLIRFEQEFCNLLRDCTNFNELRIGLRELIRGVGEYRILYSQNKKQLEKLLSEMTKAEPKEERQKLWAKFTSLSMQELNKHELPFIYKYNSYGQILEALNSKKISKNILDEAIIAMETFGFKKSKRIIEAIDEFLIKTDQRAGIYKNIYSLPKKDMVELLEILKSPFKKAKLEVEKTEDKKEEEGIVESIYIGGTIPIPGALAGGVSIGANIKPKPLHRKLMKPIEFLKNFKGRFKKRKSKKPKG